MINKDAIEKWVDALESGKYKQVTGTLTNGEGYCCLGVLCEVAVQEGVIGPVSKYADEPGCSCCDPGDPSYHYDGADMTLPKSVREWAFGEDGSSDPELETGADDDDWAINTYEAAAHLNDSHGWSFQKIAEAVRRTYLEGDSEPEPSKDGESS